MAKQESLLQKLKEIVPEYKARFIIWYYTDEDKRCPFEELMPYEKNVKSLESCLEWFNSEDMQIALELYHKHTRKYKMIQIYDSMVDKALQGDVNAAKWVEVFTKSDFFEDKKDNIDSFLKGIKLVDKNRKGGFSCN